VVLTAQSGNGSAHAVFDAYVRVLGGEAALRAVSTRTTEGRFDNGRGLRAPFRVLEKAPNKRVTIIGSGAVSSDEGSGRGYDGRAGWDRNFTGTGLRAVEGDELQDLSREADMLRPLNLEADCRSPRIEETASTTVARCRFGHGRAATLHFARDSHLLMRQDLQLDAGQTVSSFFDDYRDVGGVKVPFQLRFTAPGADVTYRVERVRVNETIADRLFQRP
jgi:hypothetical protein